MRFEIDEKGVVTVTEQDGVSLSSETLGSGKLVYTIAIENISLVRLTVEKRVMGNMGDRTKQFTFSLTAVEDEKPGTEYRWEKGGQSGTITTAPGDNTFTAGDGDRVTLLVPSGKQISIGENTDHYTTTWKLGTDPETEGGSKTFVIDRDMTLLVTNTKNGVIPSGVVAAFTLLPLLAAAVLTMYIRCMRKKQKD